MKKLNKRKMLLLLSVLCISALCLTGCEIKQLNIKDNILYISNNTSTGAKLEDGTQDDTVNKNESIGISEGVSKNVSESISVNASDSVSLGVSKSISVGNTTSKQESTSISHSYGTSASQSVSISTNSNNSVVIPDGKRIELKKENFIHPNNFDFGENQKLAIEIFEYITAECKSFDLKTKFTTRDEAERFLKAFYCCVPHGVEIKIVEYVETTYERDGAVSKKPLFRFEYKILTNKESIFTAVNKAYEACVSAGVQSGMTEKEAVKKISSWIIQHMTYEINNGNAYVGFTTGYGQCMTYAKMFEAMCACCGIECEYTVGNDGAHAWNHLKIGNTWFWSDLTWADDENKVDSVYLLSEKLWDSHWLQ